MKNRLIQNTDDFKHLRTKIFSQIVIMIVVAIVVIYCIYSFVLRGHFANWVVSAFQNIFRIDYDSAYVLYQQTFRSNMNAIILVSIFVVFFAVFRAFSNWFMSYFMDINNGIGALIDEETEDISLLPELSMTEKKLNSIKHTLEKRKLDARLAEQRKNDLVIYLAHDLKTPLASVIGYLNLLHDGQDLPDELREKYFSITLEKAERLEDLINEFFDIARFNLSNITLQYSRIHVGRLMEMILYEFQPMLKEKNLTCRLDIPENIMLKCDADKMQRVFDNLLRNAVIYSFDGTEISISAVKKEDTMSFRISNHGDTIPEDKLERIFDQFYRLDAARSTSGGAGLGLAIAKQIVELHRGTITAKSEDEVTVFDISLPLS